MIGTQQSSRARLRHARHRVGQDAPSLAGIAIVPDADRVQDGGDARADDLRVMRDDGSHRRWPEGTWPRLEVLLHVIGMQLDQAGQEEVAFEVLRLGYAARPL